ncbi:hypothetical protein VST7929_02217 [Vibrio stylophorae]|uniref:Integral membrane protein n=2 Tax=Vibrio stylophorae TaxID=659351 RepID=A0ABM8ZWB0_9VIBR|nr:hypothetical protein VST7929_02217 [Vibrio stylophorae]
MPLVYADKASKYFLRHLGFHPVISFSKTHVTRSFFALFYVTLGYQCSQWSLQSWSQKKPQGLWLAIALIGSLMTFAECYFLIKSQGMRVPVDYYFSTIIVTVALLAWCLSKVTQQPTRFSALGQHSGEIYLNHGIVQIALTSLIYLMGFYTIPEKQQFFANTVWLQVLMVPVALSLNLTGYFAIRWLALHLCGKSAVKQYRYSAMLITISIMLCFSFGAGMQHPPVVTSWAVINQVILGIAIILGITLLSMWYNQNKMWQVPLIGTVIASGVTVMALLTGYIEWSFSLLDMSKGSVSIFEALKAPVFPILPFVIGLILFNLTIYRIVDWQFTRNQERRQLHA